MSAENIALVRRWFDEVWNKGRASAIDEMLAPHGRVHGAGPQPLGRDAFKVFHSSYRNAFPDVTITLDDVVVGGNTVAARWTATGTHRGDGLGFAATNKPVQFEGMTFARVEAGQLVEGWNVFDRLGMLQQVGVVPAS
jgi:steroid delta-isomerase-like uncharacterized protein